jgi:hypothetical protein
MAPLFRLLPFERRWAAAALEGFAPPEGPGLAPRPGEADFLGAFLAMYEATSPLGRLGLRAAVWLAALAPLWLDGAPRLLGGLPPMERARLLGRMLSHPLFVVGEFATLLKLSAAVGLLREPGPRERSGYDRLPEKSA